MCAGCSPKQHCAVFFGGMDLHVQVLQQFIDQHGRPEDGLEETQYAKPKGSCMADIVDQRAEWEMSLVPIRPSGCRRHFWREIEVLAEDSFDFCSKLEISCPRIDSAPTRIDSALTRIDSAPTRIDSAPTRIDSAPTRIDCAASRFDSAASRFDFAAMQ